MIFKTRALSAFLLLVIATSATPAQAWWVTDWLFSKPSAQAQVKTQSAAPQLLAIASAAFLLPTCFLGWKLYGAMKRNDELAADIKKKDTKIEFQEKLLLRTDKAFESEIESKNKIRKKLTQMQNQEAAALGKKCFLKYYFNRIKISNQQDKSAKKAADEFNAHAERQTRQRQSFPAVSRVGHSATEPVLTPAAAQPEVQHIPQPLTPQSAAHQQHIEQRALYEAHVAQVQQQNHARLYPNGSAERPSVTTRSQRRPALDHGQHRNPQNDTLSSAQLAAALGNYSAN